MKQCYWNLLGLLHPTKYTTWYKFWCCYGNILGSSPVPEEEEEEESCLALQMSIVKCSNASLRFVFIYKKGLTDDI